MYSLYDNNVRYSKPKRRYAKRGLTIVVVLLFVVSLLGGLLYVRPVSAIRPDAQELSLSPNQKVQITWPTKGQAAVGGVGYGVLDEATPSTPTPTASTAKILTALMVMKAKPLKDSDQGPTITMTDQDVANYKAYVAKLGSTFPVTAGQHMTEKDALSAMLVVSANNIADTLAVWSYGSMEGYTKASNEYFKSVGMTQTTVADASGFSPETKSTAHDLTLAAQMLMNDPILAKIVSQTSITIGSMTLRSTNTLLGSNGVVGVKTGNTDEAGGCFVLATKYDLDSEHSVTVISVVMGATNVPEAMQTAQRLITQAKQGFALKTLVAKGTVVADYNIPWSDTAKAVTNKDIIGVVWLPDQPTIKVELNPIKVGAAATDVGTVYANVGRETISSAVSLDKALTEAPISWRLYQRYIPA